eukprot:s3391_g2.t1
MIRAVKIGENEFHMKQISTGVEMMMRWLVTFGLMKILCSSMVNGVPEALWSDEPTDKTPKQREAWVDKLADEVEIARLLSMGVLKKREEYAGIVSGDLTTRFVYDWRLKSCVVDGVSTMRWMRRSRLVAREFATTRRHDTYSPATGNHTSNLIVIAFLQMLADLETVAAQMSSSGISFLKSRFVKLKDGIMVVPGTTVEKVLACFEKFFGSVRLQKTPCDAGIQYEDSSPELRSSDSSAYRSIIRLLLYLARDRVDVMFTVKELATSMSKPTFCSLQRLRRLMGYLKYTGNMGMKLSVPEFGKGKRKEGCENQWLLETFTDADWSGNKSHRKSTSCAVHFLNGCFAYSSSRTQRVISSSSAESELH